MTLRPRGRHGLRQRSRSCGARPVGPGNQGRPGARLHPSDQDKRSFHEPTAGRRRPAASRWLDGHRGQPRAATADRADTRVVVAVSRREYRALGRELRHGSEVRRRSLLTRLVGVVLRHLPEILLVVLLVRVWQITAEQIGPLWTNILAAATVAGLVWWRRSRWWLTAALGCLLTRARLRAAFRELRLSRRSGRLPLTVALLPTAVGERVWLCCPMGVSAEDIADETDRLRAACFARDIRITRNRRFSALVLVEVIRRDPLAATTPVTSPLGRFDVPRPRQSR
jgi:hypothetical protein